MTYVEIINPERDEEITMHKTAYLDCFSGISGDMFMGALIDAGLPLEVLRSALKTLPLGGYSLDARREEKNHLMGTRFLVTVEKGKHVHRGLTDIRDIIMAGGLSRDVNARSSDCA